jgi:hypothetical protein
LPEKPQRALVFSNGASETVNLPAVREACARFNISLDVIGAAAGNPTKQPEKILPMYDLVFAKGRAALEALAVGAAVLLLDTVGVGEMVTTANMEKMRLLNFGIRALQNPTDPVVIARQIERYDSSDATRVSSWIRQTAGMDGALDRLVALYGEVLEEYRKSFLDDWPAESRATGKYLRQWIPNLARQNQVRQQHGLLKVEYDRLLREHNTLKMERERLQLDLAAVLRSPTLRLRHHLVATPLVGPLLRSTARFLAGRFG